MTSAQKRAERELLKELTEMIEADKCVQKSVSLGNMARNRMHKALNTLLKHLTRAEQASVNRKLERKYPLLYKPSQHKVTVEDYGA